MLRFRRVEQLLEAPIESLGEINLQRLVDGQVSESSDLEFKAELWDGSNDGNKELAKDIASLANSAGGIIIIGVKSQDDMAVELTPVAIDDEQIRRIRQVAASRIAPFLSFETYTVPAASEPKKGFVIVAVPPSSREPHAISRPGSPDLSFPVRDGTQTRWLGLSELAGRYYESQRRMMERSDRSPILVEEIRSGVVPRACYVVVTLDPMRPNPDLVISPELVETTRAAFQDDLAMLGSTYRINAEVGFKRVDVSESWQRPHRAPHANLYVNGAAAVAVAAGTRRDAESPFGIRDWVLPRSVFDALYLAARHAERCAASGDAAVTVRITRSAAEDEHVPYVLVEPNRFGWELGDERGEDTRDVVADPVSLRFATVEGLVSPRDLGVAAYRSTAEILSAFGRADVKLLDADGNYLLRHVVPRDRDAHRRWCERFGMPHLD